jgi:hypothetical protein
MKNRIQKLSNEGITSLLGLTPRKNLHEATRDTLNDHATDRMNRGDIDEVELITIEDGE